MRFRFRSDENEYLDECNIATEELYLNLSELDTINKYLGGYKASIKGLAQILKTKNGIRTILDIGFGGGDSIKQLSKFADSVGDELFFYGVDLKSDCVKYAEANLSNLRNKVLICDNYRNISASLLKQIDVIHCSLFLHHLTDEEIIDLFKFGKDNHCIILVNDLHRNRLAYYSIKFLTALFSKSKLVRNDAPISVLRGFKRGELVSLIQKAGIRNYSIKWSWAFRYILIANE